jgi:hypothetical protein
MKDRLLLPLALFLLRAMTPVGRVDALLKLNRLVDLDLEGEVEKAGGPPTAGEREGAYDSEPSYHTT